ncbi:hypothetical protein ACG7TL_000010 [Trametes sanguinea]
MTGFSAIPIAEEGGEQQGVQLAGVAKILGPRWAQLPAITIGLLGVQVFWSVEMSYGTPYLLSLGLTKAAVAVVFLAGPISGLVVQPLIGVLADHSRSRFGRRRPYMVVGCILCTAAMLLLGFTRPFASLFLPNPSIANDLLTIWLAILALFTIDFSINAVQAVDRALIVDTLPSSDQADANAWAARMLGVGSVAGYFIGNVDMTAVFPFLGDTELEVLAVVGSFLLLLTHGITAFCTKEKVVVATKAPKKSFVKELRDIWDNARTLPPVIRQICMIQFFSWMGWFPVLFYTSAFIGDLHKRSSPLPADDPALDAEATRLGTRALFYSAVLSLAANILLPFFVAESARSRRLLERKLVQAHKSAWAKMYERVKVGLATLWAAGHLVFAVCMFATFFYSSVWGATFFTTLTGFAWSITQWAPFSLLAEAILTEDAPGAEDSGSIMLHDTRTRRRSGDVSLAVDEHERQFLVGSDEEDDEDEHRTHHPEPRAASHSLEEDVQSFSSNASMDDEPAQAHLSRPNSRQAARNGGRDDDEDAGLFGNLAARRSHLDVHSLAPSDDATLHGEEDDAKPRPGLASKAGIIIGIHNIFIVIPQFVMTGIASLIFLFLDPSKSASPHSGVAEVVPPLAGNGTEPVAGAIPRADGTTGGGGGPNSYAVIYRGYQRNWASTTYRGAADYVYVSLAIEWFDHPSQVKFAILSHVWFRGQEDTFQDLQQFRAETPDSVLQRVSPKVQRCCKTAREQGYHWVWIDTCCINKSSSAELSEAINSMYRWYQQADVCFAFLHDVDERKAVDDPFEALSHSKWFTRGWTLQELVAPSEVLFLGSKWRVFGTKSTLAEAISLVSDIEVEILTHTKPLSSISVARRMSWASHRQTTRVEDVAYSLMGIFNVNIPIIYGEGSKAFYRLQEAIVREIPDQSIFAWGDLDDYHPDAFPDDDESDDPDGADGSDHKSDNLSYVSGDHDWLDDCHSDWSTGSEGLGSLFAPSPDAFTMSFQFWLGKEVIHRIPFDEFRCTLNIDAPTPQYVFTSYGTNAPFPVIPLLCGRDSCIERRRAMQGDRSAGAESPVALLAFLACRSEDGLVALYLRSPPSPADRANNQFLVGARRTIGTYVRGIIIPPEFLQTLLTAERPLGHLVSQKLTTMSVFIPSSPPVEDHLPSYATQHIRTQPTVPQHAPSAVCERPSIVILRPWARLALEKAGFNVMLYSTPFERLKSATQSIACIRLLRDDDQICIDFGTCADCEALTGESTLAVSVAFESQQAPHSLSPLRWHNCQEAKRGWKPGEERTYMNGTLTLKLSFSSHPSPIDLYDKCAYYDIHIRFLVPRSLPPTPLLGIGGTAAPPPTSRPHSRRTTDHVQTHFPLWKGSPVWIPGGSRPPELRRTLWSSGNTSGTMAYSYDGRYLASMEFGGSLVVWDTYDAGVIRTWRMPPARSGQESCCLLAFSPDGTNRIACNSADLQAGDVAIWSIERDECVVQFHGPGRTPRACAIAWSPDGTLFASAYDDYGNTVRIWDTSTFQQLYSASTRFVEELDIVPLSVAFWNGCLCLSSSHPNYGFRVWDFRDSGNTGSWSSYGTTVAAENATYSPSDSVPFQFAHDVDTRNGRVLVGMYSRGFMICGLEEGKKPRHFSGKRLGSVVRARFSPAHGSDHVLVVTKGSPLIRILSCTTDKLISTCRGPIESGEVSDAAFSDDGQFIASASAKDASIRIWRARDGALLNTLQGRCPCSTVKFSPGAQPTLAAGTNNWTVCIWPSREWGPAPEAPTASVVR